MTSRMKGLTEPVKKWWESKRDDHLVILQVMTMLSIAVVVWSIIFFLFLGGATSEGGEALRDWTWIGFVLALVLGIWAGPEYMHYAQNLSILNEVLVLDSRSEVMRRRKEAEEAAKLLGRKHQARLIEHYEELRIRTGRLFGQPAAAIKAASEGDQFLADWWNCEESNLARALSQISWLKEPSVHKGTILVSLAGLLALLWNAISGIVRQTVGGPRDHSLDLTLMISGSDYSAVAAPHLDLIGGLLMAAMFALLVMTRPAGEVADEPDSQPTTSSESDAEE